jgi:hypothetical protein
LGLFSRFTAFAKSIDSRDVLFFGGLAIAAYGVSLIYFPAAFVLVGLVLVAISIFGVR